MNYTKRVYQRKLDLDLSDLDLLTFNSGVCLHNPWGSHLSYLKVKPEYIDILKNRLPQEFQTKNVKIAYCIMTGPGKLQPHIDRHTVTAINYYIKSGGGITSFYKTGVPHDTMPNTFKQEGLELADQFVAKDNECFILDVSQIHNVELPGNDFRHFINFAFEEVL
jgi:hypothetical protein